MLLKSDVFKIPFPLDFSEYWAAARLTAMHQNPYAPAAIHQIQQELGFTNPRPLMMLNPPWTLPAIYGLALLGFQTAQRVWLLLALLAIFGSVSWLWLYYGGETNKRWITLFCALGFVPSISSLLIGQITPFVLAGVTAFLVLQDRRRDFAAGLCLFALGIKPHLLFLVALAFLMDSIRTRRWRMLMGAAAAYSVAIMSSFAIRPTVWTEYLATLRSDSSYYNSALGGTLLRVTFGAQHHWLQFIPSILGIIWLAWYWLRRRAVWTWKREMPTVMIATVITSSYGWSFDEVVLLVSIVPAVISILAAQREHVLRWWLPLIPLLTTNLLLYASNRLRVNEMWLGCTAILFGASCIMSYRLLQLRPQEGTVIKLERASIG
jgi:hypothetical protein